MTFISICVCQCAFLSVFLSVCLPAHLSAYPPARPPAHLPVCLSVCLSVCLPPCICFFPPTSILPQFLPFFCRATWWRYILCRIFFTCFLVLIYLCNHNFRMVDIIQYSDRSVNHTVYVYVVSKNKITNYTLWGTNRITHLFIKFLMKVHQEPSSFFAVIFLYQTIKPKSLATWYIMFLILKQCLEIKHIIAITWNPNTF